MTARHLVQQNVLAEGECTPSNFRSALQVAGPDLLPGTILFLTLIDVGFDWVEFAALEQQWLDRIPGWKTGLPALGTVIEATPAPSGAREHRVRGKCAELFVAEQIQSAAGHQVMVAGGPGSS